MEEIMVDVIDIEGKDFFLVDTLDEYNYFSEIDNPENICIMKKEHENGEEVYVSLESDEEVDKALVLYYEKFGNTIE
jgi:hypothetical protein